MKKTSFVILSIFLITALLVWFSCNPIEKSGTELSSILNEFDNSNSARLVITSSIEVNGATWDGAGFTIDPSTILSDGETAQPLVKIINGTAKNFTISKNLYGDGIWLYGGNCSVDNATSVINSGEDIITVKKSGTYTISNSSIGKCVDKLIQINDICTFTTQKVNADTAIKFIRQNGMKTWKMTSYSIDCTVMNMSECVFRSDSPATTFFYRNLTTNCAKIGYTGTNVAVY